MNADSLATLVLEDGSSLELSERASITRLDSKDGPRALLARGQALVHAKKQRSGKSLVLETPHASAAVVGTRYAAQVFSSLSTVRVTEGSVTVSSRTAGEAPPIVLKAGEELRAGTLGLGTALRSAEKRILEAAGGAHEQYTDPAAPIEVAGEAFAGMAIRRLSYAKPRNGVSYGWSGLNWPVQLAQGEERFEIWVRPRKLAPFDASSGRAMLYIIASLGTTDYRIGELNITTSDKDWMLLSGRLDEKAALNWVMENTAQMPLRGELVQRLVLRSALGELEFDYTGVVIWKR